MSVERWQAMLAVQALHRLTSGYQANADLPLPLLSSSNQAGKLTTHCKALHQSSQPGLRDILSNSLPENFNFGSVSVCSFAACRPVVPCSAAFWGTGFP